MKNNIIFVSAGEISGDIHASDLMRELRKQKPDLKFVGLGGKNMISAGLIPIAEDVSTYSTVGLVDSLRFYFKKLFLFRKAVKYIKENRANLKAILLVDNQGFNVPLAKASKKLGLYVIYYFPPHVSVWGEWNASVLDKNVDLILVPLYSDYLTFKKYTKKAIFTGHPLLDKVCPQKDSMEWKRKEGLNRKKYLVMLMPGSRYQEIENLLDPMLEASRILSQQYDCEIVLAISHSKFKKIIDDTIKKKNLKKEVHIISGNIYQAMNASDVIILSSGTASLEAVLLKKPPVICYKISPTSFFIGKFLVKNKLIGLPNIILNKKIFPELLQKEFNPERIVREALYFLKLPRNKRSEYNKYYEKVKGRLGSKGVIEKVATIILEKIGNG